MIIITGLGDPDGAEMAVRNGAWDYIQNPFSLNSLILPLKRVFQYRDELAKRQKPAVALKLDGIIGSSSQIKSCFDYLAQAANSEANVLITGETGTGKELFARAVHANGPRADRNFVVVDCAVLPETLVESSLFGHVRGAFTGADRASEGLIKQADKGTLFLNEVGELPISIQRAFLRVLQECTFRPVGGKSEVSSEFRLIAATNRDLDARVKDGKFRMDLLYRFRSLQLELPPLRQRQEDIRDMVLFYAAKICLGSRAYPPLHPPEKIRYNQTGMDSMNLSLSSFPPGNRSLLLNVYHLMINRWRYPAGLSVSFLLN